MLANNGLGGYGAHDRKGFTFGIQTAMSRNLPITIAGPKNNENWFDKIIPLEVIDNMYKRSIRPVKKDTKPTFTFKIPMIKEGIKAIKYFTSKGIKTNCTLIFSAGQALLAAKAGATNRKVKSIFLFICYRITINENFSSL